MLDLNRIYCGNNIQIMKNIDDKSIDLIVTSPPYDKIRDYNGYTFDFENVIKESYRVLKNGGVMVWVVGDSTINGGKTGTSFKQALYTMGYCVQKDIDDKLYNIIEQIIESDINTHDKIVKIHDLYYNLYNFLNINYIRHGFNLYDTIIYEKSGVSPPHKNRYFNAYEFMFIFSKGKPKTVNLIRDKPNKCAGEYTFGNVTRREKDGSLTNKGRKKINSHGVRLNIWRYFNGYGFATKDKIAYNHPAIFPEKLAEDHIISWSNENDIVLDPFSGSGTTCKMALKNNRFYIGIDISEQYVNDSIQRIESFKIN